MLALHHDLFLWRHVQPSEQCWRPLLVDDKQEVIRCYTIILPNVLGIIHPIWESRWTNLHNGMTEISQHCSTERVLIVEISVMSMFCRWLQSVCLTATKQCSHPLNNTTCPQTWWNGASTLPWSSTWWGPPMCWSFSHLLSLELRRHCQCPCLLAITCPTSYMFVHFFGNIIVSSFSLVKYGSVAEWSCISDLNPIGNKFIWSIPAISCHILSSHHVSRPLYNVVRTTS